MDAINSIDISSRPVGLPLRIPILKAYKISGVGTSLIISLSFNY